MEYKTKVAFINRKKEISYLNEWVKKQPNAILFLYGPKSSGKTTLIYKFINTLDRDKFEIKDFNLREYVIANYKDFLSVFFGIDFTKSKDDIKEKREYNLRVFKLGVEVLKGLQNMEYDAFDIMKKELIRMNESGKKPIILIDELQALEDIYINGQRELIKEIFNFFIAMTKESHLCHVIVASSDGYFIERIYNHAKLNKTSKLVEIDYLGKDDIFYWLANIDKENNITDFKLSTEQIELIWEKLGGSIWEIDSILFSISQYAENGKIPTGELNKELERIIQMNYGRILEYVGKYYDDELNTAIAEMFNKKKSFKFTELSGFEKGKLLEELGSLVRMNILYYNPVTGEYKAQGESFRLAYLKYGGNNKG